MNQRPVSLLRRALPFLVLAAASLLALVFFTRFLSVRADAETLSMARQSVRRAAVECYALEGFYPERLDYLTERYGVAAEGRGYSVQYQFIASNLMPDITVLAVE